LCVKGNCKLGLDAVKRKAHIRRGEVLLVLRASEPCRAELPVQGRDVQTDVLGLGPEPSPILMRAVAFFKLPDELIRCHRPFHLAVFFLRRVNGGGRYEPQVSGDLDLSCGRQLSVCDQRRQQAVPLRQQGMGLFRGTERGARLGQSGAYPRQKLQLRMLLGGDGRDAVLRFEILVPVLVLRLHHGDIHVYRIVVVMLGQNILEPSRSLDAGLVMVQAQHRIFEMGIQLELPEHGVFGHAVEGDVAVPLPILGMQRNEGQHVDGRFEHIKGVAPPDPVKAVARIAALHVSLIRLALGVGAALVRVPGSAVFIKADEHGVVIFLILVDQPLMGEERQHVPVYEPLLEQIRKHAAHVVICVRQGEFLSGRRRALGGLVPFHAGFIPKQKGHRFREAHAVEFLHKINGETAFLTGVPVPSVSPDRHAVVPLPAPFASGADELLALPLEEVHQVDGVGASFLIIGKWDDI
jgi:hypothetical protein